MQRAEGLQLDLLIKKSGSALDMQTTKTLTKQILEAISYLHSNGVCHRDLKPDNLIVNKQTRTLKLIDFNAAAKFDPQGMNLDEIKGGTGLK